METVVSLPTCWLALAMTSNELMVPAVQVTLELEVLLEPLRVVPPSTTEAVMTTPVQGVVRVSATVARGRLTLNLFGPDSRLNGTVGEDGALRASGLWRTPRGFNNVTVLRGAIAGGVLTGTATVLRCVTELNLRRVPPG